MLTGVENLTNTEEKNWKQQQKITVDILRGDGIMGDFYLFLYFNYSWYSIPPSWLEVYKLLYSLQGSWTWL